MNKARLLFLIEILKRYSDIDHKLSLNDIVSYLEENDITVSNRKTLYDDFKILSQYGYDIDYDNGYYLSQSPFTISEIKIIIDSLNSLKSLDDSFLNVLKDKLYSFISIYEQNDLKKLEYHIKHKDKKFINRLEDALQAINSNQTIIIKRINRDAEEIAPIFLYRVNDYYYLYYHYLNSEKIYHARFDNIIDIKLTNNIDNVYIPIDKVIEHISQSSSGFYSQKAKTVKFTISEDSDYLRSRLMDDFPNIIFTKDGFVLKVSVNEVFFSKLVQYGKQIKISDRSIADQYSTYLNDIIIHNK